MNATLKNRLIVAASLLFTVLIGGWEFRHQIGAVLTGTTSKAGGAEVGAAGTTSFQVVAAKKLNNGGMLLNSEKWTPDYKGKTIYVAPNVVAGRNENEFVGKLATVSVGESLYHNAKYNKDVTEYKVTETNQISLK